VGLSPEQIKALLDREANKGRTKKAPQGTRLTADKGKDVFYLPYSWRRDPLLAKTIGPITYSEDKGHCVAGRHKMVDGEEVRFDCACPTYIRFQGIPYCATHTLELANQMLVAKGVIS